jgi:hypothetical protein
VKILKYRIAGIFLGLLIMATAFNCPGGGAGSVYGETEPVAADVTLYLFNTSTEKYLTGDNETSAGILRLATNSAIIDTTAGFALEGKLTRNINFTAGGSAEVSLWMKGSRATPGIRLNAELAAETGIRTCGSDEVIVGLTTEPAEHRLSIPLTCQALETADNMELRVSVVGYIGPPLSVDLYTGGTTFSKVILPVDNFLWLVSEVEVDGEKMAIDFSAEVESPLEAAYPFEMWATFNITGPSKPKTLILAQCNCMGTWDYGKDHAKKGKYAFHAEYTSPFDQKISDDLEFEIEKTSVPEDSSPFVPIILAIAVILVICIVFLLVMRDRTARKRRARRKRGRRKKIAREEE